MLPINCATGTLVPFAPSAGQPWDQRRAQHLFRRMGFGATPDEIQAALNKPPTALVDALVDAAAALPLPAEPEWAYWGTKRCTISSLPNAESW